MTDDQSYNPILRVVDLPQHRATTFHLIPDRAERAKISRALDVLDVRKLKFHGRLQIDGNADWRLDAELGATVDQSCVVTLDPVTTRIDKPVTRVFVSDLPDDPDDDIEMPADDTRERLQREIDLRLIMTEALALALPDYPRKSGVEMIRSRVSPPGSAPMTDEETKPFAGLAQFKNKLEKGD